MVFNSAESISFVCRYQRMITTSTTSTVSDSEFDGATGEGNLSYDMAIQMGGLGGTTQVTISPNHQLNINARYY